MNSKYLLIYFFVSNILIGCTPKVSQLAIVPKIDEDAYEMSIKAYRDKNEKDFIIYNADKPSFSKSKFLSSLDYFPVDIQYKCNCKLELSKEQQMIEMTTYAGTTKLFTKFGLATCNLKGQELILPIYKQVGLKPINDNLLFLPIKDMTSGDLTYGGGRYLNLDMNEIVDDKITIDFNRAYNPWCAYSGGFTCPIPPKENHLMLEILAGEKDFDKQ